MSKPDHDNQDYNLNNTITHTELKKIFPGLTYFQYESIFGHNLDWFKKLINSNTIQYSSKNQRTTVEALKRFAKVNELYASLLQYLETNPIQSIFDMEEEPFSLEYYIDVG